MVHNKKAFEELYKGNRSFSVISSILAYFSQQTTEIDIENFQKEEWNSIFADGQIPKAELKHVLYKLKYRILLEKTQRQKRLMIRTSQIAAVLVLPLMLFFLFKYNNMVSDTDHQLGLIELHCPEGARVKFTLPDGSSGWLAGGSIMTYATNFEKKRNVSVDGEAFFSVKRDEKRPFRVRLGDLSVRVLGTKFNVLNYADEPISEVVVLSGLVEVTENTKKIAEQLSANKKLQLQKEGNKIYLSDVDAQSYTAWIEGRLEFNNEHLESVCRKIERFYDVNVELNTKGLEDNVFRANVKIGSLEELLKYMSLALPVKYELIGANKSIDGKIVRRKLIISRK
jgi:ferric-dicitrate binding protein FerR (iron transport regulator)